MAKRTPGSQELKVCIWSNKVKIATRSFQKFNIPQPDPLPLEIQWKDMRGQKDLNYDLNIEIDM